jgi:hypothetical protein
LSILERNARQYQRHARREWRAAVSRDGPRFTSPRQPAFRTPASSASPPAAARS